MPKNPFVRRSQIEPNTDEEDKELSPKGQALEAFAFLMRALGLMCGGGIALVGIFQAGAVAGWDNAQGADGATFSGFELWEVHLGTMVSGAMEVLLGLLAIFAELGFKFVVKYFGFLCLHIGRAGLFLLCGSAQISLGRESLGQNTPGTVALIVGMTNIVLGVIHLLCSCPCCPLPQHPLRKELLIESEQRDAMKKAQKAEKKEAKKRWKNGSVELMEEGGGLGDPPPPAVEAAVSGKGKGAKKAKGGLFKSKDEGKGGGKGEAFSSVVAHPSVNTGASDNPFAGAGGGGGAMPPPSAPVVSNPSVDVGASDNPFLGNRHLQDRDY